jgi:hypothetical protein
MSNFRTKYNPFTKKLQWVTDSEVIEGINFKEGVSTYNNLPITGNTKNDARFTNDTGHLYIWDLTESSGELSDWIDQGDIIDIDWGTITGTLSDQTDLQEAFDDKIDQIDEQVDNSLLLNFEGSDGDKFTTDESPLAHDIYFIGDAQISTVEKKFGDSSLLILKSYTAPSHIVMAHNDVFEFFQDNSKSLTVDGFIKFSEAHQSQKIFYYYKDADNFFGLDHSNAPGHGLWHTAKYLGNYLQQSVGEYSPSIINDTNWHHVAFIKIEDKIGIYLDGIQVRYDEISTEFSLGTAEFRIGGYNATYLTNKTGYIDSFRINYSNIFNTFPNSSYDVIPNTFVVSPHPPTPPFDSIAQINIDGTLVRSNKSIASMTNIIDKGVISEASGDYKRVTKIQYNPITNDLKIEYEI